MNTAPHEADLANAKILEDHIRTYRSFVFAVRLTLATAAAILILLAVFLL